MYRIFRTITILVVVLFLLVAVAIEINAGWTEEGKGWNLILHNDTDVNQYYELCWFDHDFKDVFLVPFCLAAGLIRPGEKDNGFPLYKHGKYSIGWGLEFYGKPIKFTVEPGVKEVTITPGEIKMNSK